ncbi:hypothetical protein HMPREF0044_0276 [Gleimia coleocanis DSM 15436]|uniref:TadE-like protein n=1 Tax=Gleimia coleocanis DSM 15436 TaxID=525245 RepID=C0VYN6_9ACTO|nr:hypothetical protein [Gleimia coleocanis]EEH64539.1 hypothetical protein HMPREF0044_0276 [Gleimia coleocanis DSM 15436]
MNRGMPNAGKNEGGAASLYQLAVISLLLLVVALISGVVTVQQERVELQLKADVVALGGAEALKEDIGTVTQSTCVTVAELAADNRTIVDRCFSTATEVWVCLRNQGNRLHFTGISCSHVGIRATIPALVFSEARH